METRQAAKFRTTSGGKYLFALICTHKHKDNTFGQISRKLSSEITSREVDVTQAARGFWHTSDALGGNIHID